MATLLTQSPSETEVVRYGFLLLPEFPMYALIPAIEALRVANQNKGRRLYSWHLFSADGRPVKAGNGMAVPVEAAVADVPWFPTVFVCAGNHPTQYLELLVSVGSSEPSAAGRAALCSRRAAV